MIIPTKNHVFIKPDKVEETSKAGIILRSQDQEKPNVGTIAFAGPDVKDVKVGQRVLYKKYGPDEIEVEGEKYLIGDELDIIAIL